MNLATSEDEHLIRLVARDELPILVDGTCSALVPAHTSLCLIGKQQREPSFVAVQAPRTTISQMSA